MAVEPERALTARARHALRSAQTGSARDNFILSTRNLTLSCVLICLRLSNISTLSKSAWLIPYARRLPSDEIPARFETVSYPHGSRLDSTADPRRYLKDMLIDERRDEATLHYVGNRQSKVVGRLSQL
eukprot:SAG31_NODE_3303_length_4440_cov_20.431237_2_plen_128_part_00